MTCVELQESLAEVEDATTAEQKNTFEELSSVRGAGEGIKSDYLNSGPVAGR